VVTAEAVTILHNMQDGVVCRIEDIDCLQTSIERIIADEALRQRLIETGYTTVQRFSLREGKSLFDKIITSFLQIRNNNTK
jgi:hypothetical protein